MGLPRARDKGFGFAASGGPAAPKAAKGFTLWGTHVDWVGGFAQAPPEKRCGIICLPVLALAQPYTEKALLRRLASLPITPSFTDVNACVLTIGYSSG